MTIKMEKNNQLLTISAFTKHPQLIQLWRRNAVYGLLETDSDIEQPAWSVPNLLGTRNNSLTHLVHCSDDNFPILLTFVI